MVSIKDIIKKNKFSVIAFVALIILAYAFRQAYISTSNPDLDIKSFQNTINIKSKAVDSELDTIQNAIETSDSKDLSNSNVFSLPQNSDDGISYFIYNKGRIVFWTDNTTGMPLLLKDIDISKPLLQLPNSYALAFTREAKDYTIVGLIKIKNEYKTDNEYLSSGFHKDFDIDKTVSLINGDKTDEYAVFSHKGEYIFSLKTDKSIMYSYKVFSYLFTIAIALIFFMLLFAINNSYKWLFGKRRMSLTAFVCSLFITMLALELCFYLNWPKELFQMELFSPIHYASGNIFSSLGHLLFFTALVTIELVFFAKYGTVDGTWLASLKKEKNKTLSLILLQTASLLIFTLIYEIFKNLIYNSTFSVVMSDSSRLSWPNVIFIIIVFMLMTSFLVIRHKCISTLARRTGNKALLISNVVFSALLLLLHVAVLSSPLIALFYFVIISSIDFTSRISKDNFYNVTNLMLLSTAFVTFIVFFSISNLREKQQAFYKTMAENLDNSELLDSNIFTEMMFEDLEHQIALDKYIDVVPDKQDTETNELKVSVNDTIPAKSDSLSNDTISAISQEAFCDYMNKTYFRGFWNNYDITISQFALSTTAENSSKYRYLNRAVSNAERIKDTHFYLCNDQYTTSEYIARFTTSDRIFFIEFKSNTRVNSYSYPVSLFSADDTPDITENTSVARYRNGICIAQKGRYHYPANNRWLHTTKTMSHSNDNRTFTVNTEFFSHYVYVGQNGDEIVISQKRFDNLNSALFFWIYTFIISSILLLLSMAFFLAFRKSRSDMKQSKGFVRKIQLTFMLMVVASFIIVGVVTSFYLINQYTKRQNTALLNKTHYIQKHIQDTFKKKKSLNDVANEDLNFFLQDLANTYETDTHLYDENGRLVATSQPALFSHYISAPYANPILLTSPDNAEIQTEHIGKLQYFASYAPVLNSSNKLLGYVCVPSFFSYERLRNEVFNLLAITISIYLVIILISTWISIIVSKQFSRPLDQIKNKLAAFQLKGRNEKLQYDKDDEIGKLVEQYNIMVDELNESAEKLAQSEREAAWKQMARQVTHEIKNPLTPMKLSIQMMQKMKKDNDSERFDEFFDKSSKVLIEQIESLSAIATAFSNFAKMPEAQKERLNICDSVMSVAELFRHNDENVAVNCDICNSNIFILADKTQLKQVLSNIIKNAIQSIPQSRNDGEVNISARTDEKQITIEIKDNGSGIPADIKERIFTPNFTTKNSGMGLGLAIVKNIVNNNDGDIWFNSEEGKGTTFFVRFSVIK